ncbi:hypothetical protein ABZZ17_24705 [Streptomyces sp. NPDC006512]|uniref:hypothetical protein n=1 Tax=Streptomyces sp. NPDC006512 TaxID=3154307 RepID=UPI0033AEAA02
MLINGYDDGPLVAGEPLLARLGFWSNYLLTICSDGACAERAVPEWFGDDGADADALSELLFDSEHWPMFRVPAEGGPGAVVIYRNLVGDYATDYLLTHPDTRYARQIASWGEEFSGTGLTWHELVRIAEYPSAAREGVQDTAARLLLLLPLLMDQDLPDVASARLAAALTAVGAPQDMASTTAEHLLAHLERRSGHDPTGESPLSGGQMAGQPLGRPTE